MSNKNNKKEEYAIILDYLPKGYRNVTKPKGKPVSQAIGTEFFTFFQLAPKKDIDLEIQDKVYIGKGKRDKIYRVLGKLDFENLTATSKIELRYAMEAIVDSNEEKYVDFFNTAGTISWDLHGLGLIPGIGPKTVNEILKERERKKFKSYDDIEKRVSAIKDVRELIINRVYEELEFSPSRRKHRFYLFTQEPKRKRK